MSSSSARLHSVLAHGPVFAKSPSMIDLCGSPFEIPCAKSQDLSTAYNADIAICDVTRGPTATWKDCVAPGVVEAALSQGLRRVVVASSGNHGRAIAFACRAADLEASILVYDRTPPAVVDSLTCLGATVFRFPDRATVHDALDRFIADGWFSATLTDRQRPLDAMPGSEGYRRIAVSIAESIESDPIIVVPTCYGDGASAIRRHLIALGFNPRLCLVRAAAGAESAAASIATDVLTAQVSDLLSSAALSIAVTDREFTAGLSTMEAAVGKALDLGEGGIPKALAHLSSLEPVSSQKTIVCVVTGGAYHRP